MNVRRLCLVASMLCGVMVTSGHLGSGTAAAAQKPPVVIHESVWDAGERDSWSAFTVRVSSEAGFRGELWLEPTPSQQRGQGPPPTQPGAGGRPPGQQVQPEASAPSLRAPLTLEPGVERLVSVMAPVSDAAYRAEIRDGSGRLVFAGQARQGLGRAAYNVGLLTDRRSGDALFQVGSQLPLSISRRFRTAADFPPDALSLEGLKAIVIADFDSGTLNAEQRQALQDFVALGGTLILTGGDAAGRTAGPLPEALVPVRPDATASASLAPLVDLASETTNVETAVATGELRTGRVVVGGREGPPLVVEASYGLGAIIQLTYDPFAVLAEQKTATGALRSLPWSVGLLRAAAGVKAPSTNGVEPTPGPPAPEWSVLDQMQGPRSARGGPGGLLLLLYPLLMAATVLLLGRERGRPAWRWAAVPALAVLVTAALLPLNWGLRASRLTGDEVTIERLSSSAAPALVESFHRLVPSARGDVAIGVGRATLATTAVAPRPPLVLPPIPPERGRPPGPGGDVVALTGDTRVELARLAGWDTRRLHTLALSSPDGWLESHLRLHAGRVVGTLTNHGERPVRQVRAQSGDGTRAELSDLPAGATVSVDAPFKAGGPPPKGDLEASVLATAAASGPDQLGPGELALVGLLPDQPRLAAQGGYRPNTSHRAVVTTVKLEAADDFVLVHQPDGSLLGPLGYGAPKAVCCGAAGRSPGVYELELPTGMTGSFAVEQTTPVQASVYDWTSGSWRPLPPQRQAQSPIAPTEVKNGFVQIRAAGEPQNNGSIGGLRAVAATPGK